MIWILGISFEVRGKEHIRKNHGGVILINHQSLIDMSGEITVYFGINKKTRVCLISIVYMHMLLISCSGVTSMAADWTSNDCCEKGAVVCISNWTSRIFMV